MGGVKVAGGCCFQHWQQPLLPNPPPSSSSPHVSSSVSILSSISNNNKTRRRSIDRGGCNRTLLAYHVSDQRSPFLGTSSTKLSRRRSLDDFTESGSRSKELGLRRAASASLDSFTNGDEADDNNEEDFVRRPQELAFKLQHGEGSSIETLAASRNQASEEPATTPFSCVWNPIPARPAWPMVGPEPPNWPDWNEIEPASVEMKANSVDLPLSLRIIKRRKQQPEDGFREAGDSTCCSFKKAFSSTVFIVREVQSYTLRMREVLFYENLQGILARVQEEMNSSFVWLFQQIFSCTPTLMVYIMLLLANFTVSSIGHNSSAMAVVVSPPLATQAVVAIEQDYQQQNRRFNASSVKSFPVGKTASFGGRGNGGGKAKLVAGFTDDGGRSGGHSSSSSQLRSTIVPDGVSTANPGMVTREEVDASVKETTEKEEVAMWNRIAEEASRMQASSRGEALTDPETLQQLVSPVTVELEHDNYSEYLQTELMYHQALSHDPDNVLLLSNFAQFLYLVLHDHDR